MKDTRWSKAEDTVCIRCGDPLNLSLDARLCYICHDCYNLLLDNHLIKEGEFWSLSRYQINRKFDYLNRKFAKMTFEPGKE